MLHLSGYDLSMEDLMKFRQLHSKTPGHPEAGVTPGIEVSTGPLGQGLTNAVGLAIAQAHLAAVFNKPEFDLFTNYTYVICGDGCLQEGITSEAASLAGHLGLGRLILLYDDNHITIDGETELSFTENVPARFAAYGWHVQTVDDCESGLDALRSALAAARAETRRPSLIKVRTTIGFGSGKAGTEKVHGSPLGADDIVQLKKRFGFDPTQSFVVPDDVRAHFAKRAAHGAEQQAAWTALLERYGAAFPELAADLRRRLAGALPDGMVDALPKYGADAKPLATRQHGGETINALAKVCVPWTGEEALFV
jgi:transketolase